MNAKTSLVGVVLLLLASGTSLEAREPTEPPPPLIKLGGSVRVPPEEDSTVLREISADVDFRVARDPQAKTVRFPLFEGTPPLELVQTKRRVTKEGAVVWSGRIAGQPASTVIFTASKNMLVAKVTTQPTAEKSADYYLIRPRGERVHVLQQVDPSRLGGENAPLLPEPLLQQPSAICSNDPADTIDVLVLYTPKASEGAGGPDAMKLSIEGYVEETNFSYAQSGIAQRLHLVGPAEEVAYVESEDLMTDLRSLRNPDGELPTAQDRRNATGADIVALIVEYGKRKTVADGCGQAFMMVEPGPAFESSAYAVVPRICADTEISFAHELGHLMGARHDWFDDAMSASKKKPTAESHGFIHFPSVAFPPPAFRTVMAKNLECKRRHRPCDRVPFWSNPNKFYPPSGVRMASEDATEPTNNSQTLNDTASIVANFRCRKP